MAIDPNNLQASAHLTFDDEFNGLDLWNGAGGTWATTFWYQDPHGNGATLSGNGEQEWYINANYAATSSVKPWNAANGVLTLTAAPASAAVSGLINGYGYTSGEINTYHSFSQTYGYFEMKAQLPSGQGFWPAFWLMPESGDWPPELDVMEVLGSNTSVLYNTVHSVQTGSHVATGPGGVTVADMSAGYHTYGVDWEADAITFYFDGQAVYSTPTPSDMHQPMYMIANLAAGGYWPGSVASGSVGHMNIDYIRAYASGADAGLAPAVASASLAAAAPAPAPSAPAPAPSAQAQAPAPGAGQTFTSDNAGDHWTGGAGADLFDLGRGGDVVTGGGGNDSFKFAETPWAGGHIADFSAGDTLNLTALLAVSGWTGGDPVAQGLLKLDADAAGDAQVWSLLGGHWWLVDTLDHVAPSSLAVVGGMVTEREASADAAPANGPAAGQTFTSDNAGDHWTGGSGNDTFNLGRGGDVVSGNGGHDTFSFAETPWTAGHITDFTSGDTLDLTGMLHASGWTGGDAAAQGYLKVDANAAGEAQVWSNLGGHWWLVDTLDHVAPSSLHIDGAFITG